jgi:3-hydroxymyristoyl/3-hydroxydecanoyl-(acyl carrier protein) dehydratase
VKKIEIIKITKNSAWRNPLPLFFEMSHQLSKTTKIVHIEKKVKINENVKLLI